MDFMHQGGVWVFQNFIFSVYNFPYVKGKFRFCAYIQSFMYGWELLAQLNAGKSLILVEKKSLSEIRLRT